MLEEQQSILDLMFTIFYHRAVSKSKVEPQINKSQHLQRGTLHLLTPQRGVLLLLFLRIDRMDLFQSMNRLSKG